MSKIFELTEKTRELTDRKYYLDPEDQDDIEELEKINLSLQALARQAENIADWYASHINDAKYALAQAKEQRVKFQKIEKIAQSNLDFFSDGALSFMVTHNITESRGEMFKISHSLTPGALVFDADFDAELLPTEFTVTVPAVPEHKEALKPAITEALRLLIKDDKNKLDQETIIFELEALPGVKLVRSESLRVK